MLLLYLIDQSKNALFYKLDQPLNHLRLACEVPIKRGLRDRQTRSKRRCRDPRIARFLQHERPCLQNLNLALARFGTLRLPTHGSALPVIA